MYSPFQIGVRYLNYYLKASNGKGHGMHSPFVFDFIQTVLNDDRQFYAFQPIENQRQLFLLNTLELQVEDFGAGSRVEKKKTRKVCEIAASALKPKKYGQLLFRIVDKYAPFHILELGTSLGITTSYLSAAKSDAKIITMEGASTVAAIARASFQKQGYSNIELIEGNFDETLSQAISLMPRIDLVFIDGNHQFEPTVRYFKQLLPNLNEYSILIFDDIHWSKEMEQAWEKIKNDPSVTLTIDLFFIGLVFFRKEQKVKQHFVIRY